VARMSQEGSVTGQHPAMRVPALRGANWRKRITGDGLQGGGRAYPERARGSQPADGCL
jgi:hypothetical protein